MKFYLTGCKSLIAKFFLASWLLAGDAALRAAIRSRLPTAPVVPGFATQPSRLSAFDCVIIPKTLNASGKKDQQNTWSLAGNVILKACTRKNFKWMC